MELAFASARQLATLVSRRQVGCPELLDHFIARIERLDTRLNAVVVRDFERARSRARGLDNMRPVGPLHGVPMTLKEAVDVAGLPSSWGMAQFRDNVPKADSLVAARLKQAGAVIFGKTNVPAGRSDWQSYNDVYGATGNPSNLAYSPGGSSGGAAAALAAGLTGLEVGSDIDGSIRVPAHFCGVFGHKPTWGLVPQRGHALAELAADVDIGAIGPMARSAEDLSIALGLMAAPNPSDPHPDCELPTGPAGLAGLRVALWADDPATQTDDETTCALHALADAMAKRGAIIDRAACPGFAAIEAHRRSNLDRYNRIASRYPLKATVAVRSSARRTGTRTDSDPARGSPASIS